MALTELSEEAVEMLAEMVIPCRYFQMHSSVGLSSPFGMCWKRLEETGYQRGMCGGATGCQDFICGLFDPDLICLGDNPSSIVLGYDLMASLIRSGEAPNLFTWIVWQGFRERVLHWSNSLFDRANTPSKVMDCLRSKASGLLPAQHDLPEAREGEVLYGYFLRIFPVGPCKNIRDRTTVRRFKTAIQSYLDEGDILLKPSSIIAKARLLSRANKTPDDL